MHTLGSHFVHNMDVIGSKKLILATYSIVCECFICNLSILRTPWYHNNLLGSSSCSILLDLQNLKTFINGSFNWESYQLNKCTISYNLIALYLYGGHFECHLRYYTTKSMPSINLENCLRKLSTNNTDFI